MIRRKRATDSGVSESGNDSFLDIVSNMVGILIILVIVAGLRVRDLPLITKADETKIKAAAETHAQKVETFNKAYSECFGLSRQFETMQAQYQMREKEQNNIVNYYAQLESVIRSYTETLDDHSKKNWELQRALAETDAKLNELNQKKQWLSTEKKPEAVVLENLPTPISNGTDEKEMHFRMLNGRIVFVPLIPMLDQLRNEVVRRRDEFFKQSRINGVLGPFENFRLQYTVVRQDLPSDVAYETGQRSVIMLEGCQMMAVGNDQDLGEPIIEALKPTSQFQHRLATVRQNESVVTVWVYPDSFSDYQTIKNFLYRNGYRAAVRPLDFGVMISASPQGTKSSAQ